LTVAKLIYSAITSLDGYAADEDGKFDWSEPDEEVHRFVNDLERRFGTHLYGRRLYDVMVVWETVDAGPAYIREYAEIWRAADKVVYSRTLERPASERTRIEHDFDPEAVRQLKASVDRDIAIGGPELAAQAIKAGSSTSTTCSSRRSWSAAARKRCRTAFASTSSYSTSAASATASCMSTTAPARKARSRRRSPR
jgi:dihydrofolate reductase